MKKKLFFIVGVVIVWGITLAVLVGMSPKVINDWTDEKLIVMPTKEWEIDFSKQVDPKSISNETIFIQDDMGIKQKITLNLSEDRKSVTIYAPNGGYSIEPTYYTLYVKKEIKSASNGQSLQSGKQLTFVVQETLPTVRSKQKLDEIFTKAIERSKEGRGFGLFSFSNGVEESAESESAADSAKSSEGGGYSETNNQVQGVDEADTVKTDGQFIYQVEDRKVLITKAIPAENMKLAGTILYKETFSPVQLFLHDDQLVVIGYAYEEIKEGNEKKQSTEERIWPGYYQSTRAIVYDVSNKHEPKEIRTVEVEGSYLTSRKVNEHVYLISSHAPSYWLLEEDGGIDLRPRFSDSASGDSKCAVPYTDIHYFPESPETNYTMIASFNLNQPNNEAKMTTYLGSGEQFYMSKESLYLGVTEYSHFVGSRAEEFPNPDTSIYKFSINKGIVTFHSSAEVPGTILNQFSMDEYSGHFRVVTTEGDSWNNERPSANHLYIFDENLKQKGTLEDLARGERVYSARFLGDRIYIVTFKQVDPLFVIDASNPGRPTVLGELKIPGFSNYLHPYDENHIIGFGHDTKLVPSKQAGEEPLVITEGVKISLFDITDVSNPKEKFSEVIGGRGTYSPLNYDHKALLFHKDKGLFAFPISIYHDVEGSEYEQRFEFQGAYVYNLNLEDGFQLQDKITHLQDEVFYEEWENSISRIVYIGDHLYSISPSRVTAHQIGSFQLVGEVKY
ncbi:beta-propeller domain-containing protein [Litchfieldia alkalitelluris]|uniref:beta-propeller domain-containing protein n=1 Tax=Litchfieldia alkalitelluris TaxID=304268 RepID=UPI0009968F94|nr:beta-propeller domain-containing protein [Litchfieldia alkalitelluris]